jgi:hypothetical protein
LSNARNKTPVTLYTLARFLASFLASFLNNKTPIKFSKFFRNKIQQSF